MTSENYQQYQQKPHAKYPKSSKPTQRSQQQTTATAASKQPSATRANAQSMINDYLNDILEDISMKFIINCPEEEYESFDRLFFTIEEAYWCYEDNYREAAAKQGRPLPQLSFNQFAEKLFDHVPFLSEHKDAVRELAYSFYYYKLAVPVFGAILVSQDEKKVLLLKGWNARSSWNFPRGKVNKSENEVDCAVREVREEIGYDLTGQIQEDRFIELFAGEYKVKLFVVGGIDDNTTYFNTMTRKEVSAIYWHNIRSILSSGKKGKKDSNEDSSTYQYWLVAPFIRRLDQNFLNKYQRSTYDYTPSTPGGGKKSNRYYRGPKYQYSPASAPVSPMKDESSASISSSPESPERKLSSRYYLNFQNDSSSSPEYTHYILVDMLYSPAYQQQQSKRNSRSYNYYPGSRKNNKDNTPVLYPPKVIIPKYVGTRDYQQYQQPASPAPVRILQRRSAAETAQSAPGTPAVALRPTKSAEDISLQYPEPVYHTAMRHAVSTSQLDTATRSRPIAVPSRSGNRNRYTTPSSPDRTTVSSSAPSSASNSFSFKFDMSNILGD